MSSTPAIGPRIAFHPIGGANGGAPIENLTPGVLALASAALGVVPSAAPHVAPHRRAAAIDFAAK